MLVAQTIEPRSGIYTVVLALRALSAAAGLTTAFCVYRATRLFGSSTEAAAAAIMVCATPFAIRYATEIKHYVFEAAASAAVFYAAALIVKFGASPRRLLVFLATAIVGYAFSFTLILVVFACSAAILSINFLQILREPCGPAETFNISNLPHRLFLFVRTNLDKILICCGAVLAGLVFHVVYSKPVVSLQLMAYSNVYSQAGPGSNRIISAIKLPITLVRFIYDLMVPFKGWSIWESKGLTIGFGTLILTTALLRSGAACLLRHV